MGTITFTVTLVLDADEMDAVLNSEHERCLMVHEAYLERHPEFPEFVLLPKPSYLD